MSQSLSRWYPTIADHTVGKLFPAIETALLTVALIHGSLRRGLGQLLAVSRTVSRPGRPSDEEGAIEVIDPDLNCGGQCIRCGRLRSSVPTPSGILLGGVSPSEASRLMDVGRPERKLNQRSLFVVSIFQRDMPAEPDHLRAGSKPEMVWTPRIAWRSFPTASRAHS
jgi:hypothetical protein